VRVFVDTSAWLALADKADQYHLTAAEKSMAIKNQKAELVTSEYVVDESITIIRYRVSHAAAVTFGDALWKSRLVSVEDVTEQDRQTAWDSFRKYADKSLSYTDCVSFSLMKRLRIRKAFTFDSHFAHMGFEQF
jgi:uncharacterized protein